jgi:hypothetical protein
MTVSKGVFFFMILSISNYYTEFIFVVIAAISIRVTKACKKFQNHNGLT